MARRKYWGWGNEGEGVSSEERAALAAALRALAGLAAEDAPMPPPPEALELAAPRLDADAAPLKLTTANYDRAVHAAGKSYPELLRLRSGRFDYLPDAVAYPESTDDLVALLEWADRGGVALIPFGGGSSVTGGVEPRVSSRFNAVVSVDITRMNRVLEVDPASRLVYVESGCFAPDLDAALKPHGLTIRHYPQSYYYSTVGGWIATRSSGHYSTLFGRIDDRVAALEVVAANGEIGTTRVLPGSSVGPDPNRIWIGSEGAFGFISKAWLRVMEQPKFRQTAAIRFPTFELGLEAARAIVQSGLYPAHLRVLDPFEAMVSNLLNGKTLGSMESLMIVGFESAGHPVQGDLDTAKRIAARFRGLGVPGGEGDAAVDSWRNTFFRQPYVRDLMIGWGLIVETFETAIPWRRAHEFYQEVRQATLDAVVAACGQGGVLCRSTHAYNDGIALYFTFFGPGHEAIEARLEQYATIKRAATDAVITAGGTASHHHAAGRDHAPWTEQETPHVWRTAFCGLKRALDPAGIMNPGVIFPEAALVER